MATIVEKTPSGVIYRAARTYPVPDVDLLSLLFDAPHTSAKPDTIIHASAAHPEHSVTVSAAKVLTESTASALRTHFSIGANGSNKDVVSVISTGHYLLPLLFFGTLAAGGVFSATSAASTASELSKQLKGADSKILCCVEGTKEVAVRAAEMAGWGAKGGGRVIIMSEEGDWTLGTISPSSKNLIDPQRRLPWPRITDHEQLASSLAVLIYSSGTTGLPKGVRLSHLNLVAEAVIPGDMFKAHLSTPEAKADWTGYRTLAHLPTAHIAGIQGYLINPFYMGGTVYWMPRFDFADFLKYNKLHRISHFFTVPPIYLLIAKSPAVTDQFDNLCFAVSGAAPLGKELQYAASKKLGKGKCFISQTWGLSETTGSATVMPFGESDDTGSVSPLIPNMLARIVDEDGKDVEPGMPGEVLVKGPVVSNGYHNNPAANEEAFVESGDGKWFATGDIALFKNGLFYIVDRKKELIKYKGLQVAPAELEALLLTHESILDAAVIGVETEDGTNEVPRAYVVVKGDITREQIVEWVKGQVASHKQLRGGVVFVDAIPKSPSGKILRKDLRDLAKRERGSKL